MYVCIHIIPCQYHNLPPPHPKLSWYRFTLATVEEGGVAAWHPPMTGVSVKGRARIDLF